MSRVRSLFAIALPSAIIGGFVFASPFGHAETGPGGALGFWPAASDRATGSVVVAQADPQPPSRRAPVPPPPPSAPPVPTVSPTPPTPPAPPTPHSRSRGRGRHGLSVTVRDGKVEIDGIAELVQNQLEGVVNALDHLPDVPPDARERIKSRVRTVRDRLNGRIGKLKSMDLDRLGPELERMGDEIARDMEGLDKDLEQLSEKIGRNLAKKLGKDFGKNFGPSVSVSSGHDGDDSDGEDDEDDEDKDAVVMPPSVDSDIADPADLAPAIAALRGIALDPQQKADLARLRADSDRQVVMAKRELEQLSNRLHDTLANGAASEADIARQIDSISAKEAVIRKARILTWVKVRNVLRQDQRKAIEAAVKKSH